MRIDFIDNDSSVIRWLERIFVYVFEAAKMCAYLRIVISGYSLALHMRAKIQRHHRMHSALFIPQYLCALYIAAADMHYREQPNYLR